MMRARDRFPLDEKMARFQDSLHVKKIVLFGDQADIIRLRSLLCHELVLLRRTALEENYRSSI